MVFSFCASYLWSVIFSRKAVWFTPLFLFSIRFHFSITDIKNIIESTVVTYKKKEEKKPLFVSKMLHIH